MREIHGEAKTIRQLLSGRKYAVDYYQREYKWQTKQAVELLQDLAAKFLDDYTAGHERSAVSGYTRTAKSGIVERDVWAEARSVRERGYPEFVVGGASGD